MGWGVWGPVFLTLVGIVIVVAYSTYRCVRGASRHGILTVQERIVVVLSREEE